MSIKDRLAKILSIFGRKPELPSAIERIPNSSQMKSTSKRESAFPYNFFQKIQGINMEEDFSKKCKDIEEIARRMEESADRFYLSTVGIEINEEDNILDIKEDYIAEKSKSHKNERIPELAYEVLKDSTITSALNVYVRYTENIKAGKNIESEYTEKEKKQIQFIKDRLQYMDKANSLLGEIEGMLYTVYSEDSTKTPEITEGIETIIHEINNNDLLADYYAYLQNRTTIEDKANDTDIYRQKIARDKADIIFLKRAYSLECGSYNSACHKYGEYLQNRGKLPDLQTIWSRYKSIDLPRTMIVTSKRKEEIRVDLETASRLREDGKLPKRDEIIREDV